MHSFYQTERCDQMVGRSAPSLSGDASGEVARRLIAAWESSPLRGHDGRLFDAVADLAQVHGINLTETAQKSRKDYT